VNSRLWSFGCDESFQGACFGHPFFEASQYTIVEKKSLGIWNMFPLNLLKQICKNVLHRLKNKGKEDKNGRRLALVHASSLEN
jgi:hypothetical protein